MKKKIDWDLVDKESELCRKKYQNFEIDLKRIKNQNKSLEEITKEVNNFCKQHNIETVNLKLKK